jgi:CheY-like chemotaxis protein
MAKILLVEDDKSLREIYGVRLLAEGYDIVSAGDGEEALAMAIKDRPNLIVSDVMMPKISGFDMLDILRSTTETKDIKVIMMTALSSEDQRLRGEQLGADRYLVKSQVGIEDVVRTVHEVLGDAPISAQPQNAFATPGPTAARPPASSVPPRPTTPSPAPQASPQPLSSPSPQAATPPTVVPVSTPQPQPQAPAQFQPQPQSSPAPSQVSQSYSSGPQPVSSSAPASSGLPQPTAPFSTARPAGLADRIIQPLEKEPDQGEPIADLMSKELGAPHTPPPASAPSPTTPTSLPPATVSSQPSSDSVGSSGISFEETPRSDTLA